mgnify:CR=1 FL=1
MQPGRRTGPPETPLGDADFLRVFMPYEIRLAQRRALVWGSEDEERLPSAFIGLYLVRLERTLAGEHSPSGALPLPMKAAAERLRVALRDSDILCRLSPHEFLAVVRDLDAANGHVVAQRCLTAVARLPELTGPGLRARVGFVVYPLSDKPDLPIARWSELVELTRSLSSRDAGGAPSSGYGLLRDPRAGAAQIPETDLLSLLFEDLETLVASGVVTLQRVRLLAGL